MVSQFFASVCLFLQVTIVSNSIGKEKGERENRYRIKHNSFQRQTDGGEGENNKTNAAHTKNTRACCCDTDHKLKLSNNVYKQGGKAG